MKFVEAVRHLDSLGLAVVMPDGKLHPTSQKLRKPRGYVPVRTVKDGAMPQKLREMIRRTRAEYRKSRPARTTK